MVPNTTGGGATVTDVLKSTVMLRGGSHFLKGSNQFIIDFREIHPRQNAKLKNLCVGP